MRNINFLGNPLDYAKLFELYLSNSKYLKTFNNKPMYKKPINTNELPKKLKRKRSEQISEENEDEGEIAKPITLLNTKKLMLTKSSKNTITKEKTVKEKEIPTKKLEKEVIQKIISKKKKVTPSQNKEKITNILSKRDDAISKWD